jgi:hypothetical protein
MSTLKIKNTELQVPNSLVARMADRVWRLGSKERRNSYIERARKRLDAGSKSLNDVAAVVATGAK